MYIAVRNLVDLANWEAGIVVFGESQARSAGMLKNGEMVHV